MLPRALELLLRFDLGVQRAAAGPGAGITLLGMAVRATDALNLMLFLVPLWPLGAGATLALRNRRASGGPSRTAALASCAALALVSQGAVLLVVRSQQGAARDWDMNSGIGPILALATCYAAVRAAERFDLRRIWPPVATLAVALAVGEAYLTSGERWQLHSIRSRLESEPRWTAEQRARGYDFLGVHALNAGRFAEAADHFERALAIAPNPRYFYEAGLAWWRAGDLHAARDRELEAARRAPTIADPWWVLAEIARRTGDEAGTAACLDSARARAAGHAPP
jgi:tetratricopeptide (TPR) repeat protein